MIIPADLPAVEDAIAAWIRSATGLAATHVLWADQGLPRPEGAWVSLKVISDANPTGPCWTDIEDAAIPAAGVEIAHVARETVQWLLSIQCFNGGALGIASAMALLRKVRAAVNLPTPAAALEFAGVGVGRIGPIRDIGAVRAGDFEPRAAMDVVLFLASETTELGTYIEHAVVTGTTPP